VRRVELIPGAGPPRRTFDGKPFRRASDDAYVPEEVFLTVVPWWLATATSGPQR